MKRQSSDSLTPGDRGVLATQYWHFEANVPVVVSVMRDVKQTEVPFWLSAAGFRKTDLIVANEEYEYEVWQKSFAAGRVGLGINGFASHRPHYFVCVKPEPTSAKLKLSHFFPADQQVTEMRAGAFIYEDWPDLVLTKVPDVLTGQRLLPTYRGRAREAQLVQAFRKTPFPSVPQARPGGLDLERVAPHDANHPVAHQSRSGRRHGAIQE